MTHHTTRWRLLVATLFLAAPPALPAQGNWSQLTSPRSPTGRTGHQMVYDAARGEVVLFGGTTAFPPLPMPTNETWVWDGEWEQRFPATPPPVRQLHSMAYDPVRERTVLFGGVIAEGVPTAIGTHEWDGNEWNLVPLVVLPPPRLRAAMAFDPIRREVVLFGGRDLQGNLLTDFWSYDGTRWLQLNPPTLPPPREAFSMVTDTARLEVVLFGGRFGPLAGLPTDDTWVWNGVGWSERTPNNDPGRRQAHAATFDSRRECVMVIGGFEDSLPAGFSDVVFDWDGTSWKPNLAVPGPPPHGEAEIAYHAALDRVLFFGGTQEAPGGAPFLGDTTWSFDGQCANFGSANSAAGGLRINSVGRDCPGPHVVVPPPAGFELTLSWNGAPSLPFALLIGPSNPAAANLCGGSLDIGTAPLLADIATVFASTLDATGTASQTVPFGPIPSAAPLTELLTLQGVVLTNNPCPLAMTSAWTFLAP